MDWKGFFQKRWKLLLLFIFIYVSIVFTYYFLFILGGHLRQPCEPERILEYCAWETWFGRGSKFTEQCWTVWSNPDHYDKPPDCGPRTLDSLYRYIILPYLKGLLILTVPAVIAYVIAKVVHRRFFETHKPAGTEILL